MPHAGPRTLGAVLYERFELLDLYGPLEMFGALGDEIRIATVAEGKGPVASTPGVATVARHDFRDCPALDLIPTACRRPRHPHRSHQRHQPPKPLRR